MNELDFCPLCGAYAPTGYCGGCISSLGEEGYAAALEAAFEEELALAIVAGVIAVRGLEEAPVFDLPIKVGSIETTPCPQCGKWSSGVCCM